MYVHFQLLHNKCLQQIHTAVNKLIARGSLQDCNGRGTRWVVLIVSIMQLYNIRTSYNMAARALADLSHESAKRPSAINQLSARAAML